MAEQVKNLVPCYFCGSDVDGEEDFCFGCQEHICDDCSGEDAGTWLNLCMALGAHGVDAHADFLEQVEEKIEAGIEEEENDG